MKRLELSSGYGCRVGDKYNQVGTIKSLGSWYNMLIGFYRNSGYGYRVGNKYMLFAPTQQSQYRSIGKIY